MQYKNSTDIKGCNQYLIKPISINKEGSETLTLPDRMVREVECKNLSSLSRTRRWELEKQGKFPKRIKISERAVGWLLSDLMNWMEERANAK